MLQVHDRLGDFEIIRLLGKGGMGEVYEARQFNPERLVALKVLAPWLADDEDSLRRFFQESGVPAKLDHPNIVRIITTGQTPDGIAYFTMHLVRGISLSEMIKRSNASPSSELPTRTVESADTPSSAAPPSSDGAPPAPNFDAESNPPLAQEYRRDRFIAIARIGVQAARALAFAHQQGFLHRDIKPSNVMIDHHDHVYLVDFGLTRGLGPGGDSTDPGTLIGTPWYMSPEQAEGKPIDARSDIYSLGVTLYELATQGLGPFTASRDDKHAVLAQVRAGQTLPLRSLALGIPAPLERIIVKAMQLKPGKRYSSVAEMAKDLDAFLGLSGRGSPQPAMHPTVTPGPRWSVWLGVSLAGLAITTALALYINRDRQPHGPTDDKGKGGMAAVNLPKLDGSKAWPKSLRTAQRKVEVLLVDKNNEPVWQEHLYGNGKYLASPNFLQISSPPPDPWTLFALADPDWPFFEFSVEMSQLRPPRKTKGRDNELGLFFGWRRESPDTSDPGRFFVLRLDESAVEDFPRGRLSLGTARLVKETELRAEFAEWGTPLPGKHASLRLNKSEVWHEVTVRVLGENVTVKVDNETTRFRLSELQRLHPAAAENLRTSGAVGIWARAGNGSFRRAKLMMLDPEPE